MELVVLFPESYSNPKNTNKVVYFYDEKFNISPPIIESTPENIITSLSYISLHEQQAINGEIIKINNYYDFPKCFKNKSPGVLKINETDFLWLDIVDGDNINEIIEKSGENQAVLFEFKQPFSVASYLNPTEEHSDEMEIHLVEKLEQDQFKFFDKIRLTSFENIMKGTDMKMVYYIADETGSLLKEFTVNQVIEELKSRSQKYYTVVMEKRKVSQMEKQSEVLRHGDYKVAFSSPVKGEFPSDLKRMSELIKYVNNNADDLALHSPSISICQSSGSGKTKLACSVAEEFPTAYVVFRESDSISYPEQNYIGNLFMNCPMLLSKNGFTDTLDSSNIGAYCTVILAIMEDYLERVKALKTENMDSKCIQMAIKKEFVLGIFEGSNLRSLTKKFKLESLSFDQYAQKFKELSRRIGTLLYGEQDKNRPFVLIFDEAPLLSEVVKASSSVPRLNLLRRALHALGTKSYGVFLLLGTKADYVDLSPEIGDDSLRDKKRTNVLPAFIVSRNWDIFGEPISQLEITDKVILDPRFALMLFSLGRPLWTSLPISKVIDTAVTKLRNSSLESGEAYYACWCIRTGLPTGPRYVDLCRHLIKSNLATLLNVHPEGKLMNVCYPSEPVLAMAAREIINKNPVDYFARINHFLRINEFNRGDLAEILSSEFCLQAMSKAHGESLVEQSGSGGFDDESMGFSNQTSFILKSTLNDDEVQTIRNEVHGTLSNSNIKDVAQSCYKVVTVKSFLISLYGQTQFDNLISASSNLIGDDLLNGLMNFTHFIRLDCSFPFDDLFSPSELSGKPVALEPNSIPSVLKHQLPNTICRETIQYALKRSAAFFASADNYGVDLFLPVCLKGKDGSSGKPALTLIPIQVKASFHKSDVNRNILKLNLENQFVKCPRNFVLTDHTLNHNHGPKQCSNCESNENLVTMFNKQMGLIFYFSDSEKSGPITVKSKTIPTTSNNITVIYNNNLSFLISLYGNNGAKINEIVNEMLSFNWLPHEFIPKDDPAIKYYTHQLTYTYLDKPIYPQVSDHYRRELGWGVLRIENDVDKYKESLEHIKKSLAAAPRKT